MANEEVLKNEEMVEYETFTYECDEFIDGLDIADKL